MTAPDRIWVNHNAEQVVTDLVRHFNDLSYTRTDIYDAVVKENERLREALVEIAGLGIMSASDLAAIALRKK